MYGYAALDLETTGLYAGTDGIIEFSAILFDQYGKEEGVITTLLNPGISIPPEASRVNNITDSMVALAPTFDSMADEFERLLAGRILVGHNIKNFDMKFLTKAFSSVGIDYSPPAILDTLALARIALPRLTSHRLVILCDIANIPNESAHRAESDARATWHLLCALALVDIDDLTDLDKYNLPIVKHSIPEKLVATKAQPAEPDLNLLQTCVGEVVVFTGVCPEGYPVREDAAKEVIRRGGRVASSVTKKTTVLFCGDNAGTKLDRARELGKSVYPPAIFADFLRGGRALVDDMDNLRKKYSGMDTQETATIQRYDGRTQVIKHGIDDTLKLNVSPAVAIAREEVRVVVQKPKDDAKVAHTAEEQDRKESSEKERQATTAREVSREQSTPRNLSTSIVHTVADKLASMPAPITLTAPIPSIDPNNKATWLPPAAIPPVEYTKEKSYALMAVTSVILGFLWFFGVTSVLAIVLGLKVRRGSGRSALHLKLWSRVALLGVILGVLGLLLLLLGLLGMLLGSARP